MKKVLLLITFLGSFSLCFASDGEILNTDNLIENLAPFVAIIAAISEGIIKVFKISKQFLKWIVSFVVSVLLTVICYFLQIGLFVDYSSIIQLSILTIAMCFMSNGLYTLSKQLITMFLKK